MIAMLSWYRKRDSEYATLYLTVSREWDDTTYIELGSAGPNQIRHMELVRKPNGYLKSEVTHVTDHGNWKATSVTGEKITREFDTKDEARAWVLSQAREFLRGLAELEPEEIKTC